MKTGLITPVTNIDADIMDCKRHLECEFGEFCEAWNSYHADETNKKNMAHLLEELVDLATACMTLADRIEKEAQIPDLVNNTLLMVGAKNYTRGYHDTPMI
jgi:hypothetical protein